MNIKTQDFEQIKSELISLYFQARKYDDFYVCDELDYLISFLQRIENQNISKKQKLTEKRISR